MLLPNACRHPSRNGCFFWKPFPTLNWGKGARKFLRNERDRMAVIFFWRTRTQSGNFFWFVDVQTQAWTNSLLNLPKPQSKRTFIFKAATHQTKHNRFVFWICGCANASLNKFLFARAKTPIQTHFIFTAAPHKQRMCLHASRSRIAQTACFAQRTQSARHTASDLQFLPTCGAYAATLLLCLWVAAVKMKVCLDWGFGTCKREIIQVCVCTSISQKKSSPGSSKRNSHPPTCCNITPGPPAAPWSMLLPNACRHPRRNGCFFEGLSKQSDVTTLNWGKGGTQVSSQWVWQDGCFFEEPGIAPPTICKPLVINMRVSCMLGTITNWGILKDWNRIDSDWWILAQHTFDKLRFHDVELKLSGASSCAGQNGRKTSGFTMHESWQINKPPSATPPAVRSAYLYIYLYLSIYLSISNI